MDLDLARQYYELLNMSIEVRFGTWYDDCVYKFLLFFNLYPDYDLKKIICDASADINLTNGCL